MYVITTLDKRTNKVYESGCTEECKSTESGYFAHDKPIRFPVFMDSFLRKYDPTNHSEWDLLVTEIYRMRDDHSPVFDPGKKSFIDFNGASAYDFLGFIQGSAMYLLDDLYKEVPGLKDSVFDLLGRDKESKGLDSREFTSKYIAMKIMVDDNVTTPGDVNYQKLSDAMHNIAGMYTSLALFMCGCAGDSWDSLMTYAGLLHTIAAHLRSVLSEIMDVEDSDNAEESNARLAQIVVSVKVVEDDYPTGTRVEPDVELIRNHGRASTMQQIIESFKEYLSSNGDSSDSDDDDEDSEFWESIT